MWVVVENKFETIEVPVAYKNVFMKIVDNFSVKEVEERIFLEDEDFLFFSEEQEEELVWLDSYKILKNTINNKFWWK